MIARLIHDGKTAQELGLDEVSYQSRKETLERFYTQWDGTDFEAAYRAWLKMDQSRDDANYVPAGSRLVKSCCDEPVQMTKKEKVASFAKSVGSFALGKFKVVEKDRREERLNLCKTCEHYTGQRCLLCGCFMSAKTWIPTVTCPAGKW